MENRKIIKDMLYLETQLDNRIHGFIENALRRDITEQDINDIRHSLEYIIDEQLGYMKI